MSTAPTSVAVLVTDESVLTAVRLALHGGHPIPLDRLNFVLRYEKVASCLRPPFFWLVAALAAAAAPAAAQVVCGTAWR